jgi:hypothetical protein
VGEQTSCASGQTASYGDQWSAGNAIPVCFKWLGLSVRNRHTCELSLSIRSYIHTYIHTIHTSNLVQAQLSSKSPCRFEYYKWCREQGEDPIKFEFLFEVHVLGITRANRCFNDCRKGFWSSTGKRVNGDTLNNNRWHIEGHMWGQSSPQSDCRFIIDLKTYCCMGR